MKKTMTLAEVKAFFENDRCFETETGFLVNDFGKYRPNITFVIPKVFDLGKDGKPLNPIAYVKDPEVTGNMNLDFDGSPAFIFGDFWRSKKGGACFRPKNPMQAKHLLIRVDWGGCFNNHRGNHSEEVQDINELLYFRRASSNGGGSGYDYWVLPVGYSRTLHLEEVDGNAKSNTESFEERAKVWRKKHADLQRKAVEEADSFLREKAASEEASKMAKDKYLCRLTEIQAELAELSQPKKFGKYRVEEITLDESYFNVGWSKYLYSGESLAEAERHLSRMREWVTTEEARKQADADAKAEFEPDFLALASRFSDIGWRLDTTPADKTKAFEPYDRSYGYTTCRAERAHEFPFSQEGFVACLTLLESTEKEVQKKREAEESAERLKKAQEEAKALGLPSNVRLWHRSGATNAGEAWVITPKGMDRECDWVDTSVCESNNKRYFQTYEGDHVWNQIMPGELVIYWRHAYTAAPHEFEVIYRPETLTEAQQERVAEIENDIEEEFFGKVGLTGNRACPSIGNGWGLF